MSKQKCVISKKRSNFTIIPNNVAQNLNYCLDALGLYLYLFSLPNDWVFHKNHLQKTCNIGIVKLNNLLRILAHHKLIKIEQVRNEKGQFAHFNIHVDDGSSFENINLENIAQPVCKNNRPVENRTTVNSTYKEDIKKEDIKTNKDKSICATESVAPARFKEFWSVYPRKKDKKRAEAIWKIANLDNKADEIIKDVKNRLLNDHTWRDEQFIPYPKRYLDEELWGNEITIVSMNKKSEKFNAAMYALNKIKQRQQGKLS